MEINTIDTVYQQLELFCLQEMQEFNVPASLMTYVVARLLANVESMHLCEKSQPEVSEEVRKDMVINLGEIPEDGKDANIHTGDE